MITTMMNKRRGNRFSKLPDDGDPWAPNNLLKPGAKEKHQDPVVQSIVSLTISLRHKFVKQISAKVTNTLLFFVEKM